MADAVSPTTATPGAGLRGRGVARVRAARRRHVRERVHPFRPRRRARSRPRSTRRDGSIVWPRSSSCSSSPASPCSGGTSCGWRRASCSAHRSGSAIALTFLGRVTPSSDHPLVAFGNPLGGLALVALGWWLVLAASPATARRPARPSAGAALVAAAFAAVAAIVIWTPGLVAGLAVQLAATVALVAGVTLVYRRRD